MKKREDLIYPELSYQLVGVMYDVHNQLGGGLKEKTYEQTIRVALESKGLNYKQQIHLPIKYNGTKVSSRFLDFLVDDKIIVELKAGKRFTETYIRQISEYLKTTGIKLGLLVNFGEDKVTVKRVVNDC